MINVLCDTALVYGFANDQRKSFQINWFGMLLQTSNSTAFFPVKKSLGFLKCLSPISFQA